MRLVTTENGAFLAALRSGFQEAQEAWLLVAYARYDAFRQLRDEVQGFFQRGGRLRALFDLERLATDPDLLEELATVPGDSQCRGFMGRQSGHFPQPDSGLFHAKVYAFRHGRNWSALVGSSNLTVGGLSRNREANLLVSGTERSGLFGMVLGYVRALWDSAQALPVDDDRLLTSYRQAVELYRRSEERISRARRIQRFYEIWSDAFYVRTNARPNVDIAYLWGLLCAAGRIDFTTNEAHIEYKRGELNRGTSAAGRIYFEGISALDLPQQDALDGDAQNVVSALNNLFNRAETGDAAEWRKPDTWRRTISVRFRASSPFLRELREYATETTRDEHNRIEPYIPEAIRNSDDDAVKRAFLRGYYDVKCRVATTDRLPSGPLRVAISVSGRSDAFSEQLVTLIRDVTPDAHPNFLRGAGRGRETLIRLDAREFPTDLLSATWKKQAVNDFAAFNEQTY